MSEPSLFQASSHAKLLVCYDQIHPQYRRRYELSRRTTDLHHIGLVCPRAPKKLRCIEDTIDERFENASLWSKPSLPQSIEHNEISHGLWRSSKSTLADDIVKQAVRQKYQEQPSTDCSSLVSPRQNHLWTKPILSPEEPLTNFGLFQKSTSAPQFMVFPSYASPNRVSNRPDKRPKRRQGFSRLEILPSASLWCLDNAIHVDGEKHWLHDNATTSVVNSLEMDSFLWYNASRTRKPKLVNNSSWQRHPQTWLWSSPVHVQNSRREESPSASDQEVYLAPATMPRRKSSQTQNEDYWYCLVQQAGVSLWRPTSTSLPSRSSLKREWNWLEELCGKWRILS